MLSDRPVRKQEYKVLRVKLPNDEFVRFNNSLHGQPINRKLRELANEYAGSASMVSNVAGQNIIEFNSKKDSFVWKIRTDSGEEKTIIEDASIEFLQDLLDKIRLKLSERDGLIGKKNKRSVAVPRRLVK